jgi:major type 1 subunit fimbrin (pilin)
VELLAERKPFHPESRNHIMKKMSCFKPLGLAVGIAAMATSGLVLAANDGTLTFKGELKSGGCDIGGGDGASGSGSLTVQMPTIDPALINKTNLNDRYAGNTAVTIILKDSGSGTCTPSSGKGLSVFFEPIGDSIDSTGKLLKNTESTGAATGVFIVLRAPARPATPPTGDSSTPPTGTDPIVMLTSPVEQPWAVPDPLGATGVAKLRYLAQYSSPLANAMPGKFTSAVKFTINYN